jgi:hypothetical protein
MNVIKAIWNLVEIIVVHRIAAMVGTVHSLVVTLVGM